MKWIGLVVLVLVGFLFSLRETQLAAVMGLNMKALGEMAGFYRPHHYVILLQNNMELRPTGGFMGSYGDLWVDKGTIKNLIIQDIYVPDGQIKGYVKEPDPMRKYLFEDETPGWRLRDSNWDPDFVQAAKAMKWFFEEGGLSPLDGIIGLNLHTVNQALTIIGPVNLPDYGITITDQNFYSTTQAAAEQGFFPGSTQKGDFLKTLGKALRQHLFAHPIRLAPLLLKELSTQQITVAAFDETEAWLWQTAGWDGRIQTGGGDFIYLNEANLGINKTNCCVERTISDEITLEKLAIKHTVIITYVNHNPPKPEPPKHWGGGYKNYLRVIIPKDSQVIEAKVNGSPVDHDLVSLGNAISVGLLSLVQGGETGTVEVNYLVPHTPAWVYGLTIQKQPGIESVPYIITFKAGGKSVKRAFTLDATREFRLPMLYSFLLF